MNRWMAILVLLAGCSSIPFHKTAKVPVGQADPVAVVQRFREKMPERVRFVSHIVFDWRRSISAIGYTSVDYRANRFDAVCLTPMGMKLFEVSGDGEKLSSSFVLDQFTKQGGDFTRTVGEDIRHIYFDQLPAPDAEVSRDKYEIAFRGKELEHIFAGENTWLVRKNCYREGELIWRVSYYDYREIRGKIYPFGVILNNYQHGYRLIVYLKEVQDYEPS